jgi:RimJ/RimL family protein N-acetyltransferase
VREASSGRGLGTSLLAELSVWAERTGLHRLELTVMAHNERALALYRRCGFEVEGTRRHSLLVDGRYVDELLLANLPG